MIRRALPSSLHRLAALEEACAFHPWSLQSLKEALHQPNTTAWLFDDPPIGYCLERTVDSEVEILSLGVHPEYRGRGHARRMLQEIIDQWNASGVTEVWLEVREANVAARRLYSSSGWTEMNRRVNYYGVGEHAVCMRLGI